MLAFDFRTKKVGHRPRLELSAAFAFASPRNRRLRFLFGLLLDMDLGRHQDSRSVSREVGGVLSIPHSHTTQF